jgi:hypothetical protein
MTLTTPTATESRTPRRRLPWSVVITAALCLLATLAIFPLSHGTLPFQIKLFDDRGTPFLGRVLAPLSTLAESLVIMGLVYLITRQRTVPDLAARAPSVPVARMETLGMVGYTIVAQIVGALLGHAIGHYAISLHMPGTLYGLSGSYTAREAIVWATYNFVVYALVPFVYFRARGYTREQLSLRSNNLRADALLIVIIVVVESVVELISVSAAIFSLSGRQLAIGAPLAFVLNFVGTVLPVMIVIYSILLPRYLRLTNSIPLTIILGGLTYAAVHAGESWATYRSLSNALLSVIFLTLQYLGPGMVKSLITLRTANAWVHALAYHAVEPHVIIDTPTIVTIFHIH